MKILSKNITVLSSKEETKYIIKTGSRDTYAVITDTPYDSPTTEIMNGEQLSKTFGDEVKFVTTFQGLSV